jgi:hypothetical protein
MNHIKNFYRTLREHLLARAQDLYVSGKYHDYCRAVSIELTGVCFLLVDPGYSSVVCRVNSVFVHKERIYQHRILRTNYTTYNVRRGQDIINPNTAHCNVMVPASAHPLAQDSNNDALYAYARVLGIYHANVICVGSGHIDTSPKRINFLWVRWYRLLQASDPFRLDKVVIMPLLEAGSTGFIDPAIVLRSCHIIPNFTLGTRRTDSSDGVSLLAQTRDDSVEYYINQ